jgi:N-acetylglucosaminyldiphosphoundecaprenol N-acetyl-beta-D-mannosaminyltransferase
MKNIRICGLPITVFDNKPSKDTLLETLDSSRATSFHGYSIDVLNLMKVIPNLYQMRESNDYFLCDGRGYYYFLKLLGVKGIRKTSLPNLVMQLVEICHVYNKKLYLLGATEESNTQAITNLKEKYGLTLVEGRNGFFNYDEEKNIVLSINESNSNILFLGMSSPKKDEFVYRWKGELNVQIIVHCGGMIDVLSGKTKLYPRWIKDLCLAGLFRFLQEPKRLSRDFFNIFPSAVIAIKMLWYCRILHVEYDYQSKVIGRVKSPKDK